MKPEQIQAQRRQVAVDSERHFWVTRLSALVASWRQTVAEDDNDDFGLERQSVRTDDADELDQLIAERTK